MEKKGLNTEMTHQMLQEVEQIRRGFQLGSRVTVTELGRSTQWRSSLDQMLAMEVVDRNQTTAILLKPDTYLAVMKYMQQMEAELEQAQVEALMARREHQQNWTSGDDLAAKAKASLQARQERIREVLDGDR